MKSTQDIVLFKSVVSNFSRQKSDPYLINIFAQWGRSWVQFLTGGGEPKIWQTLTQNGEMIWNVYDPKTRKTEQFMNEEDVRIWIEQRYYL